MRKIKVGDWVRFYRDRKLVIGSVQYVSRPKPGFSDYDVQTDQGEVNSDSILEVRSEEK